MGAREVLLARKQALLEEYQRNQVKLSKALRRNDFNCDTVLDPVLENVSGDFTWSPDGTSLLSIYQGYLHLINLKTNASKLQKIPLDGLLYSKFLSKEVILCITEASVVLFTHNGEEIVTLPCLHFDKDISVLESYLLPDHTVIVVFSGENGAECTAFAMKKNQDSRTLCVLGSFTADHVFECVPFYARHDQDSWTVYGIAASTLQHKFIMAGSYPIYYSHAFMLAICREELALLSPSGIVKSLPIEPDWYAWTRSGKLLFILHSQYISVIDLLSLEVISALPHTLKDLTAAAKISSPASNPHLLLVTNNGANYFFRIKF